MHSVFFVATATRWYDLPTSGAQLMSCTCELQPFAFTSGGTFFSWPSLAATSHFRWSLLYCHTYRDQECSAESEGAAGGRRQGVRCACLGKNFVLAVLGTSANCEHLWSKLRLTPGEACDTIMAALELALRRGGIWGWGRTGDKRSDIVAGGKTKDMPAAATA